MASEVNHHVGYSRENECWFVRFYPYQTEQQASEAAAAFTRAAPAATDTGLETVETQLKTDAGLWVRYRPETMLRQAGGNKIRELCDRSQAEELLATERAEKAGWKELHDAAQVAVKERTEACNNLYKQVNDLKADNAAQAARIAELEQINADLCRSHGVLNVTGAKLEGQVEALEAKLAAAEKALMIADEALQADALAYAHAAIRAVLGGKPS